MSIIKLDYISVDTYLILVSIKKPMCYNLGLRDKTKAYSYIKWYKRIW